MKLLMFGRTLILALVLSLATSPIVRAQQNTECNVRVTLLQVNDVYQFMPVDLGTRGGIGRVLTLRKTIQSQNPNTLFLLAGDTISPSVESITYKGAQMIDAWNAAGLDYATFGNHEFDFGPDVLKERMKESRFGWITANVVEKSTGKPFGSATPFVIREFGGVKIGIFGLTLPETKITSSPGPDVDFLSPCETAKAMVTEIHKQGAKVVVALTHLSMREDKEVARCANVDLIIGGHEHTLLESSAGGAPIFKMTAEARELGRIDLNISKTTGELSSIDWQVIPVTSQTAEDSVFSGLYRKYSSLLTTLDRPVGRTAVALDGRSAENRTQETNLGNFVADSIRRATLSDVALVNGGSIRVDEIIRPGRLTERDVLSILPFKNKLVKIEVTGELLRRALEHGVSMIAQGAQPGAFPQVSGIQFSYDASRQPGDRIVQLKVNGQPVSALRKYSLATTTFVAVDGGDGYAMLKNAPVLTGPDRSPLDSDALRRALIARAIAPKIEGRIQRLDKSPATRTECE
ncbi:MAG TPA: 5'-nucleotidase C-terminal domain-containing protein [Pyrinomonadaceae bacterium]|nr:5'-nucleotidase C-terminal domain-containing protein [Pyrinomonadaceae bacterium]